MSAVRHKSIAKHYKDFPEHPIYVTVDSTDGSSTKWPTNTREYFENDGSVNWMKPVSLDEAPSKKWRHVIGRAVGVQKGVTNESELARYVLKDWPRGYGFFDHHKGGKGRERHDLYLFGSTATSKFRSPPEFIPHVIWLLQNMSRSCECKYCAGTKSQAEVTAKLSNKGYYRRPSSSPSPAAPMRKLKGGIALKAKRPKDSRTFAAVQRKPSTVSASIHVSAQPMVADRKSDIDAMTSQHEQPQRRWSRKHEVVWVQLNTPITNGSGTSIPFWPGVVTDHYFKPVPHRIDDIDTPWTVEQSWSYKISLFAILQETTVSGDRIIPWLAYTAQIGNDTFVPPISEEEMSLEELQKFNPMSNPPPSFDVTAPRWMLACNVSNHVGQFYCVTDHFNFEFELRRLPPQPTPGLSRSISTPSLADALNASSQSNADAMREITGSSSSWGKMGPPPPTSTHRNITAPLNGSGTGQIASMTIGTVPSSLHKVKQDRFQGLWWGSERIWVDDFVRVKLHRRCLAPEGTDSILKPAGPSQLTIERHRLQGNTSEFPPDAGSRGLFMHLSALFIADVVSLDGKPVKECRASGVLYELADEDWEDQELPFHPTIPRSHNPKATLSSNHVSGTPTPTNNPALSLLRSPLAGENAAYPMSGQTFHLPLPPQGYKFRPILKDGYEAVFSLSLLAGRYYPGILRHPLLSKDLTTLLSQPARNYDHLWALEGLCINFEEEIEPMKCKSKRDAMLDAANTLAREEFLQEMRNSEQYQEDELGMDTNP